MICVVRYVRQVFEEAVVRRVDGALGLLCELPPPAPGGAALTPGYAHISALDDEKVESLDKVGRAFSFLKENFTIAGFLGMQNDTWMCSFDMYVSGAEMAWMDKGRGLGPLSWSE